MADIQPMSYNFAFRPDSSPLTATSGIETVLNYETGVNANFFNCIPQQAIVRCVGDNLQQIIYKSPANDDPATTTLGNRFNRSATFFPAFTDNVSGEFLGLQFAVSESFDKVNQAGIVAAGFLLSQLVTDPETGLADGERFYFCPTDTSSIICLETDVTSILDASVARAIDACFASDSIDFSQLSLQFTGTGISQRLAFVNYLNRFPISSLATHLEILQLVKNGRSRHLSIEVDPSDHFYFDASLDHHEQTLRIASTNPIKAKITPFNCSLILGYAS